jgi:hypothetical protein
MKNKQSQVAAQKNPNADQTTDFPLPDPMEIARLAAILRPAAPSSLDALKAAVKCYFEVVVFVREQAPAQIKTLLEKWQAVQDLKNMKAANWADTVTFDEARDLIAQPRKLAERLDKLPKEREPLPTRGTKVEPWLHERPGVQGVKSGRKLKEKVLDAVDWQIRQLREPGIKIDEHAVRQMLEESFRAAKIPIFLLEHVVRYEHEKRMTSNRESARRKTGQKKSSV